MKVKQVDDTQTHRVTVHKSLTVWSWPQYGGWVFVLRHVISGRIFTIRHLCSVRSVLRHFYGTILTTASVSVFVWAHILLIGLRPSLQNYLSFRQATVCCCRCCCCRCFRPIPHQVLLLFFHTQPRFKKQKEKERKKPKRPVKRTKCIGGMGSEWLGSSPACACMKVYGAGLRDNWVCEFSLNSWYGGLLWTVCNCAWQPPSSSSSFSFVNTLTPAYIQYI